MTLNSGQSHGVNRISNYYSVVRYPGDERQRPRTDLNVLQLGIGRWSANNRNGINLSHRGIFRRHRDFHRIRPYRKSVTTVPRHRRLCVIRRTPYFHVRRFVTQVHRVAGSAGHEGWRQRSRTHRESVQRGVVGLTHYGQRIILHRSVFRRHGQGDKVVAHDERLVGHVARHR